MAEKKPAAKKPAVKKTTTTKAVATKTATVKKVAAPKEAAVKTVAAKGKYIAAVGRRKSAIAQVRLYPKGNGQITVNDKPFDKYFDTLETQSMITNIIKQAGADVMDFSVKVHGGGRNGQAEAVRHGIARALVANDEALRSPLKSQGWLSRDARVKERKKPGLKKARRAPQWSKR